MSRYPRQRNHARFPRPTLRGPVPTSTSQAVSARSSARPSIARCISARVMTAGILPRTAGAATGNPDESHCGRKQSCSSAIYFSVRPSSFVLLGRSTPMATTAVSSAVSYARENQKRFLDELKDLLRIPSVSTAEEHKDDVRKAAEVVANDLKRIGFEHVEIIPTKGHPLVYADWLHAAGKPTALCYAHYDVQPAEPLDEWTHSAVRAYRAQPEHLRARRGGRQGPALDAAQGLRVAVQGRRRQAAHQRSRAHRRRRRSWRREH